MEMYMDVKKDVIREYLKYLELIGWRCLSMMFGNSQNYFNSFDSIAEIAWIFNCVSSN